MTASEKLAHKRLTLLQLAEKLGNISKACRMHKVSRSQFYEYKRSFQVHGFEGLVDKPPVPGSHPSQLSKKMTARIIALSLEHPAFGQQRIADQLALEGVSVCATSVRNVWIKDGLEAKYKRLLRLEEKSMLKDIVLSEQQIKLLEKVNPEFDERQRYCKPTY